MSTTRDSAKMSKSAKSFLSEDLFIPLERIFSLGGIWPSKPTYIRFAIYIVYFSLHLIMTFADLMQVFGNLELMVMNLVELLVYVITYPMVWVVRCSQLLKQILSVAKHDIAVRKAADAEEEKIYYNYYYSSKIFFRGSTIGMIIAVTSLFLRPLLSLFFTNNTTNETMYILPFRVRLFFTIADTRTYALVYLYLGPVLYLSVCHMTAICLLVTLILQICADLSVLSYRVRNINVNSTVATHTSIRKFVRKHLKIIWMAKSLDNTFNLLLLDELLGNSVVLAISMYYVLLNFGMAQLATCWTFAFFAIVALVMLYGYCLIGEQLIQQSMTLQDAYYHCDWRKMPHACRASVLICMIRAQVLLNLTAGKFYIFSLSGFTEVVKSSLAYLSMLRTLL